MRMWKTSINEWKLLVCYEQYSLKHLVSVVLLLHFKKQTIKPKHSGFLYFFPTFTITMNTVFLC